MMMTKKNRTNRYDVWEIKSNIAARTYPHPKMIMVTRKMRKNRATDFGRNDEILFMKVKGAIKPTYVQTLKIFDSYSVLGLIHMPPSEVPIPINFFPRI